MHRDDPAVRPLAVLRTLLVLAATASVLADAPAAVRTPLVALAAVGVAGPLLVVRGSQPWDAVIVAAGGLLVGLMALGLGLDLLPGGLTRTSWGIGTGLVELGLLGIGLRLRAWAPRVPPAPTPRRAAQLLGRVGWSAAAAAVVAGALVIATRATDDADRGPLQLAVDASNPGRPVVVLSSATPQGPFDLLLTARGAQRVLARRLLVGPGMVVREPLAVRPGTRATITLLMTGGSGAALRTLVVQP